MFIRTSTLKIVAKPNKPVLSKSRTIAANDLNIEHVRQYQKDIKRYYRAALRG